MEAMDPTTSRAIYCHHSLGRQQATPRTLHEKMMLEAEPIIQHNWTDVAIHDRDKLKTIPVGCYCYWIVGQMGSYLTPAYCKISDRHRWSSGPNATVAPVQMLFSRWHGEAFKFQCNSDFQLSFNAGRDKHCYLIVKTDTKDGEIIPITFRELAKAATYGKIKFAGEA
jgi:hypothetical protein